MRDEPTYAEAVQRSMVGDDPLGLAPTNERLYNSAFPGFNNYVRHIRVYSAICWMTKQVSLSLETGAAATTQDARRLFEAGIEKVELALLWANRRAQGVAGSRREFPIHNRPIEFTFGNFGASMATLFAAVTYKPSLTNGLRFLEARTGNTYGCLPFGEALADAFDESARELPGYRWLKAPDKLMGTRTQVEGLAPTLDVEKPSPAEQAAFLDSFFPAELDDDARNDDRARWLTLTLMLRSIDAVCKVKKAAGEEASASSDEIRACMARGITSEGSSVLDEDLERVQAWWAVLQVRQLQRLCLETLYCVVERWIALRETDGQGRALAECIRQLSVAGLRYVNDDLDDSVGQLEGLFVELQGDHASLYEAAAYAATEDGNDEDVFMHIARLKEKTTLNFDDEGDCEAVSNAYIGLVFCAVETANLAKNPDALQALRADGDTCSMLRLVDLVKRFSAASVEEFIGHVIKEWVVLRHFEVVASRSIALDGKNRFRFVMGDNGLERFDKGAKLPVPAMSADKLDHALLLSKQAGLLSGYFGYQLTPAGRWRLRLFARSRTTRGAQTIRPASVRS